MRIFLIHGVNKRRELSHAFEGADGSGGDKDGFSRKYEQEGKQTEKALHACCEALNLPAASVCPIYWGHHGARFHYYEREQLPDGKLQLQPRVCPPLSNQLLKWLGAQQSLGTTSDYYEPELTQLAERLAAIAARHGTQLTLAELTLVAPAAVLDALLEPELRSSLADEATLWQANTAVAIVAERLTSDAALRAKLLQLRSGTDGDRRVLDLLQAELALTSGRQAQGFGWVLRSGMRLVSKPVAKVLQTQAAYSAAGLFFGDSIKYFAGRDADRGGGPIIQDVRQQLDHYLREQPNAGPTVFVTHSLGGALFYDLFTHFEPGLHFDLWVSVGTQLSFYEDAKLLRRSFQSSADPSSKVTVPLPAQAQWVNVLDPQDWLAFEAQSVFQNVKDEQVRIIGEGPISLHTGYFRSASFYNAFTRVLKERLGVTQRANWELLARRLREAGVAVARSEQE